MRVLLTRGGRAHGDWQWPVRRVPRPDASGIDSGKAQRLPGWQATRSWRDYLTESGEPR